MSKNVLQLCPKSTCKKHIVEMVEEHLKKRNVDSGDLFKSMENSLGMSRRAIGDCFRFITDMTLADYIRLRNLAVAFTDKIDNNTSWSDASCKCGYSEESAFQRAFKNAFGITPAHMEKSGDYSKLMHRLSLENVMKGKQMQGMIEVEKSENNINGLEERVNAELEEKGSVDTFCQMANGLYYVEYCMDLLGVKCNLSEMSFEKAIEVIVDVEACASIFGLDVERVLLIYELLNEKDSLYSACDLVAQYYKDLERWDLIELDLISMYFTINFGFDKHLATEMAKTLYRPISYLKTLSYDYVTMYARIVWEDKEDINIIPFTLYTKLKNSLHSRVNYQKVSIPFESKDAEYMLYKHEQRDVNWLEAIGQLLRRMSYGELIKFNVREELSETDVNALLLVIYYDLDYKIADAIAKNIIPFIKDIEHLDSEYVDFIRLFGDKINCELNMGHYLKFMEIVDKYHENKDHESFSMKDLHNNIDGLDSAFECYIDSKRVGALMKKYNMPGNKVRFAERICNRFVKQEEAYQLVSVNYNNGLQDQIAIFLSHEEKLAIILSLNTKRDIHLCEAEIRRLFEGIQLDDNLMKFYVELNEIASKIRTTEEFKLISVADCLKIKASIADRNQEISNIRECVAEHLLNTNKPV